MDDSIYHSWTLSYVVVLAVATVTTGATLVLSFKDIKVRDSAVQYVAYSVCRLYFIYSLARLLLYVGVLTTFHGLENTVVVLNDQGLMGANAVYSDVKELKIVAILVTLIGDCALLCTTFFITTLAYELKRLIINSMDRGQKHERAIIRQYCISVYLISGAFAILMAVSACLPRAKSETVQTIASWFGLACIWTSVLYPVYATMWIARQKHRRSAVDPSLRLLHQRIKTFVLIYCAFVLPSGLVNVWFRLFDGLRMEWLALSQILYYLSGAGTAFAIGISVTCCYRALSPFMPPAVYEQLLEGGFFPDEQGLNTMDVIVEAPTRRPIFVVTDIEGSSQLWAVDSEAMAEAQSTHDDLLRQQLLRYRGYEITTAGDSFHLAFHSVRDAIHWCVSVQEKLLKAPWPTTLLQHDKAARVYDIWTRLLFTGLRVRMAIHDGDDRLVYSRHPTTGKMTYLGISEMMVREMSEMGQGGQIIMSDSALALYMKETSSSGDGTTENKFQFQSFRNFEQPEWNVSIQMHEVLSTRIGDRYSSRIHRLNDRLRFLPHLWSDQASSSLRYADKEVATPKSC